MNHRPIFATMLEQVNKLSPREVETLKRKLNSLKAKNKITHGING